ncbi:MAG TPA: type II secretion system F family protein [Acetobacteraceae bacterium]|nr:type II secretion system F family protein [Acetobacteraceae bacterium]
MIAAIIVGLSMVLVLGVVILRQDSGRRRLEGRVIAALAVDQPSDGPATQQPVRLSRTRPQAADLLLRILCGYRRGAPGQWPHAYTFAAGLIAALASIIFGGMLLPRWEAGIAALADFCLTTHMLFGWQRRRYANKLLRQMPDVVELVISSVRAGLPVSEAFRLIAHDMPDPSGKEFRVVANELSLGRSTDEALRTVFARTGVTEYAIFSVTLAVQGKSGGRLADTLRILGDTIRQRIALAGRAKALAGEAALSARVLASLPIVSSIIMYFERPTTFDMFFHDARGEKLISIGLLCLILGILTMRHMIRKGTTV